MGGPTNNMQPAPATPTKLTYDDFLRFPDDGQRHEIIDGEHYVTPTPVARHQRIALRLSVAVENYLRGQPLGEIFFAPFDVILSNHDVVEPDLLFVSNERAGIVRDWAHGAPDLVVEILSPSSRRTDEIVKRDLYDRFDVREYWVVDPELDLVKVYRRQGGRFARVEELTREEGQALTTPLLPGLAVPLDELFR